MIDRKKRNQLDESEEPNKGYNLITLIAVFLVAVGLTGTAWYVYDSYGDKPEGEVIVISADNDEIKIKPLDPGGMIVDNMDKAVYDTIDKPSADESKVVEKLLPAAEEPINKKTMILENQETADDNIVVVEDITLSVEDNKPAVIEKEIAAPKIEEEYIKPIAKNENSKKADSFAKKNEKFYKVQIASFRSKNDVEKEWNSLSKRFPKLIGEYNHYIVTRNIEGKGIFHRLQIGPFDKESDANRACKQLKEFGINCFLVKP